ncbi:uncharacterized protein LOC119884412 [Micropterus salmoides]|uniref:uncharacterized protein LOC119884412 n=2 Tax=Micropterus salmoides TaxID=27706 RepID=UPI0018ED50E0|nr:uncharacterized protein LOC119884412 [Micropterus salmoides]
MKNMLTNVTMFFKHIEKSFLSKGKLKQNELKTILHELKRIQAEIQRLRVHSRQKRLCRKTDDQLHAVQQSAFMTAARENIPKLFEQLESSGNQKNEHSKLMGYIMGYLCTLTGHRSVVLTNMTKENVVNFVCWNHGKRFQVLIDDQKTMQSFGQAAFNLNEEEFRWLENLVNSKCCPQGQTSDYVFHTTFGKKIAKAENFLHLAWADCGMKGTFIFPKIESSLSTQNSLPPAPPHTSRRELDFLSEESAVSKIHVYTPSKCFCVIEKLRPAVADYYLIKANLSNALPRQAPLADPKNIPAHLAEQSTRFQAAQKVQEEPNRAPEPLTAKTTDEYPTEQVPGKVSAPLSLVQQTPNCMLETQEKDEQSPSRQDPGCVPDPMIQETTELIPETPEDQMPQTQAEEVQKP